MQKGEDRKVAQIFPRGKKKSRAKRPTKRVWPPPPFRFAVVVVVSDDDKLRLRDGGGRALGINLTSSSSSHSSELLPGHRKREREGTN